jgi:hypothetical protein
MIEISVRKPGLVEPCVAKDRVREVKPGQVEIGQSLAAEVCRAVVADPIVASTWARVISAETMSGDDRFTPRIISCAAAVMLRKPRPSAAPARIRIICDKITAGRSLMDLPSL